MSVNIQPGERVLVVAPHPDDESIGCGGFIALYHDQVDVLLVTDGCPSELQNSELAQIRQAEFVHAMETANVHGYFMLHIPEREILKHQKKFNEIDFSVYAHIFVPNRYERHRDHTAVYRTVRKKAGPKTRLYEYEVWTTIRNPNIIVDIASAMPMKQRMISCHASQVQGLDYPSLAAGLNTYRGLAHGMVYAEAYDCRRELAAEKIRRLKRKIKAMGKKG